MKSLVEFIKESKNRIEIRIEIKKDKNGEEYLDTLRTELNEKGIYNENIDKGLKFAIQGDDKAKYIGVLDLLKGFELENDILANQIKTLEDWINEEPEEKEEIKDPEGETKKEEE